VNNLEEYVLNITEPFDITGFNLDTKPKIIIEKLFDETISPWEPRLPEHASGSQHVNVGLDLFSASNFESQEVNPHYHFAIIRTGIRMELPYGHHMMIGSRSGLGFRHHLQAFPGIIDHSYRGEILIKIYGPSKFSINTGDKIAQGLIFSSLPYIITEGVVDVNTERGEKGFGSTDR
jgi:deoxyuridine 5'-triphosphate nucleotidohydrolase